MKLLFVADPLETFKTYKDTTFAMMREAAARGHELLACEPRDLVWERGGRVSAHVRAIALAAPSSAAWFVEHSAPAMLALASADAVIMRKDPPFDSEYFYATHLLAQAEREGARVFNKPAGAARASGKARHPRVPAVHRADDRDARRGGDQALPRRAHQDIVLKPLDGMGGMGIFRVGRDGLNLGSITETLNRNGTVTVMAQRYLTEITAGDKRILVIDGVAVPHALARIPQGSEIRGNLAVGGKGVAQPLSARDREIAEAIGPVLAARGLLAGRPRRDRRSLTEINVTSPTGFQEITQQSGFDVAKVFVDALERAVA